MRSGMSERRPQPFGIQHGALSCGGANTRRSAFATRSSVVVLSAALGLIAAGCRQSRSEPAATPAPAATTKPANPPPAMAHGDHNPHHGGVVLMKGDLHYEAIFDPTGKTHQLFFSDAVREDLPAAFASAVSFTIKRRNEADELVPMQIDAAGESWIGSGRPIADPASTTIRIAFTVGEEPYWLDVPMNAGSATHEKSAPQRELYGLRRPARTLANERRRSSCSVRPVMPTASASVTAPQLIARRK